MNTLETTLELQLREDPQDGYLATLYGRAVPYDTPTRIGGITEEFQRESFEPSDVIGKPLAWRHEDPIGVITAAHNREDGLYITASIVDTAQGRDANALLRAGAVKGLSVGFIPRASSWLDKAKTRVKHTAAQALEVSLTHKPAYATAGVSAIREEESMSETTVEETAVVVSEDVEAREAIAQLRQQLDAVVNVAEPVHPLAQYRDAQQYIKAVLSGDVEERTLNVSALSEQTGLVPPNWLQEIKGVFDRGRPCINALGGPSNAGSAGLDIKWPISPGPSASAVGTSGGVDGTEVTTADHDITVGSATLAQYSGANRLPYLVIERSSPEYLGAYLRHMVGSYNLVTDNAFQTALWANDTSNGTDYAYGSDTDGSGFIAAAWDAATDCQYATGQAPEVVFVASNIWAKLPSWSKFQEQNYPISNAAGDYNIAGVSARLGGLPVVLARNFATDGTQDIIVTNRYAIQWAEDGPRFAQADQPGSTSRDIAIYGYGVATPFVPTGVVSIYNTP